MESPISIHDYEVESIFSSSDNLMSMERLDRTSPELWPESVPGRQDFPPRSSSSKQMRDWMGKFNSEDMKLLAALSAMPPSSLVSEVKKLFDAAYQLGCDEYKETTRGKLLKVLIKHNAEEPKETVVEDSDEREDGPLNNL